MNKDIVEKAKKNYMDNYSQFPISIKSGKGMMLRDEDGKEYLDFVAGIAVNILGYGDEGEKKALYEAIEEGVFHTSNLYYNRRAVELAEILNKAAGSEEVFFANSGAEANEAALKMARKRGAEKGKSEIISFQHSFHGRTYGAITVTGQDKYKKGFSPLLPEVLYGEYNNIDSVKKIISDKTAAIIAEPLQGEGGIVVAEKEFLEGLRELAEKYDALLIFDEVQCGMGRTGKAFCFQHYGVEPDIVTLAKALGGGLPMGATLAFKGARGIFSPGDHASTFGGNVLSSALSLVVFSRLESLSENAFKMGKILQEELKKLVLKHPDKCGEVRGLGLIQGLELKIKPNDVVKRAMEKGLLLCSASQNVLRFVPPLIVEEENIMKAVNIVDSVLSEI